MVNDVLVDACLGPECSAAMCWFLRLSHSRATQCTSRVAMYATNSGSADSSRNFSASTKRTTVTPSLGDFAFVGVAHDPPRFALPRPF